MEQGYTYDEAEGLFHGWISRVMGTRFEMLVLHPDNGALVSLWERLVKQFEAWERVLNRFDPESEVSRVAALAEGESIEVSPTLDALLQEARRYHRLTEGLFDSTLGRCPLPEVQEGRMTRRGAAMVLDFGGIAKGYALRWLSERFAEAGVRQAFVDFGRSSILGVGHHPYGDCWQVEVLNPYTGGVAGCVALRDEALSTSGNTPAYAGHIVRPDSGEACREHQLAVIKSRDPLDAEVLSTVWMIATEAERKRISERFEAIEAVIYKL